LKEYILETERLGLRNWIESDIEPMFLHLNQDPEVMRFFPRMPDRKGTAGFVKRMQEHCEQHKFCYFAVDRLDKNEFIGFIGLLNQDFESDFTPCVDMGWRLKKAAWNNGFATEGAAACLKYAFDEIGLKEVYSMASVGNVNSEKVMRKIGLTKVGEFDHVRLLDRPDLKKCVLYKKINPTKK